MKGCAMSSDVQQARFATADKGRQCAVDHIFVGDEVARRHRLWHGERMRGGTSKAGGIFLTIGILGGLVAGIVTGSPMGGILLGTLAGIALALITWLIDRRRAA